MSKKGRLTQLEMRRKLLQIGALIPIASFVGSLEGQTIVTTEDGIYVADWTKVEKSPPLKNLPRKKLYFPSYFRNGGEIGSEDFITEIHIGGPIAQIHNVKMINVEIHIKNYTKLEIQNCQFDNLRGLYV